MLNTKQIEQLLNNQIHIIEPDLYNQEYNAYTFKSSVYTYRYRRAKIIPTKPGAFVVMWEKNQQGTNIPFDCNDFPDYLIIEILEDNQLGYFIFSKELLREKGILTDQQRLGKMGFRVYPDWLTNLNQTASKSQKWQIEHFTRIY